MKITKFKQAGYGYKEFYFRLFDAENVVDGTDFILNKCCLCYVHKKLGMLTFEKKLIDNEFEIKENFNLNDVKQLKQDIKKYFTNINTQFCYRG